MEYRVVSILTELEQEDLDDQILSYMRKKLKLAHGVSSLDYGYQRLQLVEAIDDVFKEHNQKHVFIQAQGTL